MRAKSRHVGLEESMETYNYTDTYAAEFLDSFVKLKLDDIDWPKNRDTEIKKLIDEWEMEDEMQKISFAVDRAIEMADEWGNTNSEEITKVALKIYNMPGTLYQKNSNLVNAENPFEEMFFQEWGENEN